MAPTIEQLTLEQGFDPMRELDTLAHENIVNHLDYTEEMVDTTIAFHENMHESLIHTYESINAIT